MTKQSETFSPKNLFAYFALGEAITWGLLILGLLAREFLQVPGVTITVVGATHGFMFLSYSVTAALVGMNNRWSLAQTATGVILAIVPFATVPYEKWLLKRKMLDGLWRRDATKNPKDKSALDRLFRWLISRPRTLVLLIVVFVVSLFSVLLSLGPPDQWGS